MLIDSYSGLPWGPWQQPDWTVYNSEMIKGVFVALGILMVLMVIPIANVFVGIPFGAFIGAYFGISHAGPRPSSKAIKSLVFGGLLGLEVFLVLLAVAAGLTATVDLRREFLWILWLAVIVYTLYTASMGALGAMYAQLRASGRRPAYVPGVEASDA
jgi:hypothetical protein